MDKVLILGAGGFTGRHFQNYIARNKLTTDYNFIGVDRVIDKRIEIDYRQIDLIEGENIRNLIKFERPEYIINFSGVFDSTEDKTVLETNAELSRRILEISTIQSFVIKNILLIGSAAEYGRNDKLPLKEDSSLCPVSLYGLSKVIQTHYALYYHQNFGLNVNVARTFNLIGSGMASFLSISSFLKQIANAVNGDSIYVGNLNTKRDFLDISDAVDAYWKVLINGKRGRIYNVCSGKSYMMKDILDYMIRKTGKEIRVVVNEKHVKKNDISDSYGDNSRLVNDTGWNCNVKVYDAIDKILKVKD